MEIGVVVIGSVGAEDYEIASSGMLAEEAGGFVYVAVAAEKYGAEPRRLARFQIFG